MRSRRDGEKRLAAIANSSICGRRSPAR
jgi:hypothetical protein